MSNITTHLNNIKNALYGKDVRGSIHDGIDAINNEVENTTNRQEHLEDTFNQLVINSGNSNAEIVDARVGENGKSYEKLGDRLDEFDSQLEQKANEFDLDTERKRIDLLAKIENGETEGNTELLDIRNGINGKTYNLSGDAVRDSLNAIYNGLGGIYCKDFCNLTLYSSNSQFGTIKNSNTIVTNSTSTNLVPSTNTYKNHTYLVYCSSPIKNIATVSTTEGVYKDEGVFNDKIGIVKQTSDDYKVYVTLNTQQNLQTTIYIIDITGYTFNEDDILKKFNENYINNWYFNELNGVLKLDYLVKNVGKVESEKLWTNETWTKIDGETIKSDYDSTSTVTIKKNIKVGEKYAVLFTGLIKDVKTINASTGTWTNTGSVTNNVGIISIDNDCTSLQMITGSSGANKVYCIDITNNIELENFLLKYGVDAINCDYKSDLYQKILDLSIDANATPSLGENAWSGKKWIAYGDSITEQNSYVQKVAKKLGLKVTNKGIGGTTVSDITGDNTNAFCRDERINTFDEDADLVTIMGGTNDWNKTTIGDLTYDNGFDTTKFMGALATTIVKIQKRCPNATIVVCSLIGGRGTQSGVNENIPLADQHGQTSLDFAKATKEVAEFMNVEFCDTWSCGINNWNRVDNIEDAVHPTQDKGTDKIAIKLVGALRSIEPLS